MESPVGEKYPASTVMDGGKLIWDVSDADTAAEGTGRAQLTVTGPGGEVLKSAVAVTRVGHSLRGEGEAPEPLKSWVDDAVAKLAAVENAIADAQQVADDIRQKLEAGDFVGTKGDKGDPGEKGKDAPQIDDAIISASAPWSSAKIVETVCPELVLKGNPVTCYPLEGTLIEVKAEWEPEWSGSGTPSLTNIRPISGKSTITISREEDQYSKAIALPHLVAGGKVAANNGQGNETWAMIEFDGTEAWFDNSPYICLSLPKNSAEYVIECSHFESKYSFNGAKCIFAAVDTLFISSPLTADYGSVNEWKSFLAAQKAAGTPVQIAYPLETPIKLVATGIGATPAIKGTNTFTTNADSLTLTETGETGQIIKDLFDRVTAMETGAQAQNADMTAALKLLGISGEEE